VIFLATRARTGFRQQIAGRRVALTLAEAQRQAVAMAVLTQLHLAYLQYADSGKEYARVRELADVDESIYRQVANRTAADAQAALERIAAEVAAVSSELRQYESYADLQAALGRLYDTLGINVPTTGSGNLDVVTLTRDTDRIVAEWQKGGATPPSPPPMPNATQMPALPASATTDNGAIGGVERFLRGVFGE
jgi:hypothetical protein